MNSFDLSRSWFNFSFENPEKVKPIHAAIFFFAIEHCNRLGNKEKFGFPSQMTMDAIGVKNYQTYGKALKDLEDWGFIIFIERSKNQYSANIISISAPTKNSIARGKALDKATLKHDAKQTQSTVSSTVSIDKPLNQVTNKPLNQRKDEFKNSLTPFLDKYQKVMLNDFFEYWTEHGENDKKMRFEKQTSFGISRRLSTWAKRDKEWKKEKSSAKKEKFTLTMADLQFDETKKLGQ